MEGELMLRELPFTVDEELLNEAESSLPEIDFRLSINQPTGNFFYDPWVIKPEYQNTVWEKILNKLPYDKGEARIIKLDNTVAYASHADIDDRWHLNITGNHSYLIDLDERKMFETVRDGKWYEMNAGKLHTAVNLGNRPRYQLVVRKLLFIMKADNWKHVTIKTTITDLEDARFEFDNQISPLLNKLNKLRSITNFEFNNNEVNFYIEPGYIRELKTIKDDFIVNIDL